MGMALQAYGACLALLAASAAQAVIGTTLRRRCDTDDARKSAQRHFAAAWHEAGTLAAEMDADVQLRLAAMLDADAVLEALDECADNSEDARERKLGLWAKLRTIALARVLASAYCRAIVAVLVRVCMACAGRATHAAHALSAVPQDAWANVEPDAFDRLAALAAVRAQAPAAGRALMAYTTGFIQRGSRSISEALCNACDAVLGRVALDSYITRTSLCELVARVRYEIETSVGGRDLLDTAIFALHDESSFSPTLSRMVQHARICMRSPKTRAIVTLEVDSAVEFALEHVFADEDRLPFARAIPRISSAADVLQSRPTVDPATLRPLCVSVYTSLDVVGASDSHPCNLSAVL